MKLNENITERKDNEEYDQNRKLEACLSTFDFGNILCKKCKEENVLNQLKQELNK